MYLKRYFVEGLAHASYLFGADGEAAVVDPKRDVDDYIADAEREGLRITAILNSHPHADFASGFRELSQRTGAKIYISHLAPVKYEHVAAKDGDRIEIGSLEVEMLETPGHSPDSLSFLVRENTKPEALFTGDVLFVNDVGRPDLRDADEDPRGLASKLYDSLFGKILVLPDEVKVYPAHGAGSFCGRAISSAPFTLIGQERRLNWAMQIKDREKFVRQMTSNLPDRPAYFSYDVGVNLRGAKPLNELPGLRALTYEQLEAAAKDGAKVIDTRSAEAFGAGHFRDSLNIGLDSELFSTWVGFLVPGDDEIVLVVESATAAERVRLELARIGFDNIVGYIGAEKITTPVQLSQLDVCAMKEAHNAHDDRLVLDVRTLVEWEKGHLEGSLHVPLATLSQRVGELPKNRMLAVLCRSGYRSSIAASLLQSRGFSSVQNVAGGLMAYEETQCS